MRESIRRIIEEEVLTPPQAARLIGKSDELVRTRIMENRIDHVKKGNTNLLDKEDVLAWGNEYVSKD